MSQSPFASRKRPVPPSNVQVESIGVRAIDQRRVDVAVDVTPCTQPLTIEIVIVGPTGDELCSVMFIDNTHAELDRVLHLREDAAAGDHTLHVGAFFDNNLVARASRIFAFALPAAADSV